MRPDQHKKFIRKFDEAVLHCRDDSVSNPKSRVECSIVPSFQNQTTSCDHQVHVPAFCYPPSNKLSIAVEDSGLNIHKDVLSGMWEKVEKLINMERGLQPAASSDNSAWSVQSFSSLVPHFVTSQGNGQFLCDAQCPQWVNMKICSHTLAVAEKIGQLSSFLNWYSTTNQHVNVTSVGMLNMPKGRGLKGGVPKRKRVRKSVSEPEQITSRPSLTTAISSTPSTEYNINFGPFSDVQNYHSPTYYYSGYPFDHHAPNDLCIAHAEKRPYRDNSGNLVTPTTYKPSHYHAELSCVRAAEPSFIPYDLNIPPDVLEHLSSDHKYVIWMKLGLQL